MTKRRPEQDSTDDATLATNSTFPLSLDQSVSTSDCQTWCPWDLQLQQSTGPQNDVYSYPNDSIQTLQFNPCYSVCAKYNHSSDCCVGRTAALICASEASTVRMRRMCVPDAYSYGELDIRTGWNRDAHRERSFR